MSSFPVPETAQPLDPVIVRGRSLFYLRNNATSADGRVCASCHPDGRDDGLTWTTPEGPRNTPMLVKRLEGTAPYGWDGANADLSHHLDPTIRRLFGTGLIPNERDAIFAYIATLDMARTSSAPEEAEHGRQLFVSTGCARCHAGESLSDDALHDVGNRSRGDAGAKFDTPSLRFVSKSAPYFHDGRYTTLGALLDDKSWMIAGMARLAHGEFG